MHEAHVPTYLPSHQSLHNSAPGQIIDIDPIHLMASSTRPELVQSAITFLLDPSAQSAPLAKRIAFLESKGLTSQEIDEAIRLSNSPSQLPPRRVGQYGVPIQNQVQDQGRDWRDWFIMAVIGGSVGYLTIALARVRSPSSAVSFRVDGET